MADSVEGVESKVTRKAEKYSDQRKKNIRAYRQEASRLASMANKRLERLKGKSLEASPAYVSAMEYLDGGRFGIRGKDYNEVQQEMAHMRRFLEAGTSTIRGSNRILREMASNTGIKFDDLANLQQNAKGFFELASKIEQYLRTTSDSASAVGYQEIWDMINKYVEQNNIELDNISSVEGRLDVLTSKIVAEINKKEDFNEGTDNGFFNMTGWYQLDRDD